MNNALHYLLDLIIFEIIYLTDEYAHSAHAISFVKHVHTYIYNFEKIKFISVS